MHIYEPRTIASRGRIRRGGWDLKHYAIALRGATFEPARFQEGLELALEALPAPALTESRTGTGFVILHQGQGVDYCVLGWWDRENELPLRVFVREPGASWRPARGSESVCVWDLEVIAAERDAYVETVMSGSASGRAEYLARTVH